MIVEVVAVVQLSLVTRSAVWPVCCITPTSPMVILWPASDTDSWRKYWSKEQNRFFVCSNYISSIIPVFLIHSKSRVPNMKFIRVDWDLFVDDCIISIIPHTSHWIWSWPLLHSWHWSDSDHSDVNPDIWDLNLLRATGREGSLAGVWWYFY